jgi:tyrosyl-tRNA synthetase
MSKSVGNYVGIDDLPREQFGKVMSIPDDALAQWRRLTLDRDPPEAEPMTSKLALARGIVELYHGVEAAREAEAHFTRVVREGRAPEDVPVVELHPGSVHLPALLASHLGNSTSHWRRVIAQRGVRIEDDPVTSLDVEAEALAGRTLQAGKREFLRFVVAAE